VMAEPAAAETETGTDGSGARAKNLK